MAIVNGKVVPTVFTKLKIEELSAVDRPAQLGARAVIMKRADDRQPADARAAFMGKARAIAKRDAIPMTQAMGKAISEHPAEFAAMQAVPAPVPADHSRDAEFAKARKSLADFDGIVREIAKRDGISLSHAMGKARAERPDAFSAAYG